MTRTPTCPHGTPLISHGWLNVDDPDRPTLRMRCLAEAIAYDPHSMGPQRVRDFYDHGDAAYSEWCWMIVDSGFIPTRDELHRARRRRWRRRWPQRMKWRITALGRRLRRETF